ncbi:hypothetical protein CC1G_05720 [Coprinopsis cinerea okayama7|uniref:Protein BFR2 n=1 Tax=Coprinopsis cinerea (strain Okayama-7 / 130 / ATCC MYA-4618 / FGSC 9003) TaxID=240176 RepID=A8N9Z3_COPC7|nr:hypothetical protein CC1G_05720 [Coprinopsis cinerea okayama7\|eukprot:XP_001831649.2 hypothetical protein CC1G_05720 [Coprinopsis cinerea okayama7\
MTRLSLAQQLAQLDDAAPVDYDPEALETYAEDDGDKEGAPVVAREHYVDVGELRKLHDSLADPKYEGVRTSRKALLEAEEAEASEPSDSEAEQEFHPMNDEDDSDIVGDGPDDSEGESSEEEGSGAEDDDEEDEGKDEDEEMDQDEPPSKSKRPAADEEPSEDLTSALKQAREADKKKGKAVAKQIALWDTLLDSRIQLQKAVVSANKLPLPDSISSYTQDPECADALLKLSLEALALADDLTTLQEKLMTTNENIKPPARKRRKLDDESNLANASADLVAACESAAALEQVYHPQLVQTLTKWSAKIQAVAPSVLLPSNRGAFSKGKQQLKSAVQLVDDALQDHSGLLARTRLRRAPGTRLKPASETNGKEGEGGAQEQNQGGEGEEDVEIFDDTDFYQKMLRDIIDARGGGDKDADWLAIQKQKKAKKVVDTKASKGRKIRYHVHEKIQNFMVPVPVVGGWHEEQIDELFSSLLGKGFENAVPDLSEEKEGQAEQVVVQDGFRVFG